MVDGEQEQEKLNSAMEKKKKKMMGDFRVLPFLGQVLHRQRSDLGLQ